MPLGDSPSRGDEGGRTTVKKISFPLELRDERVDTPLRFNTTDISENGCYVETVMPLSVGTALRVELWMGKERVTPGAVVRTRDPGVGTGIEFTGLPEESKKKFQAHPDKLDPGIMLARRTANKTA